MLIYMYMMYFAMLYTSRAHFEAQWGSRLAATNMRLYR